MEDILVSTPPEALDAMLAGTTATVLAGGHTHIQQMNFSKCELPHTPRPIPERRWRAGGWALHLGNVGLPRGDPGRGGNMILAQLSDPHIVAAGKLFRCPMQGTAP